METKISERLEFTYQKITNDKVLMVVTLGDGSMDYYSRKLAENLAIRVCYTDIYQKFAECRNTSWLGLHSAMTVWHSFRFIRMLNKQGGIIHLPNHHLGRYGNFLSVPYIITVHDLIRYFDLNGYGTFIHRPNSQDKFYLRLDYQGIKKAKAIIAVSQSTKKDLIRYLTIPAERITVVHEGIDHSIFHPVSWRIFEPPYILFVGSEHPRKNFTGLLKAFRQLKNEPGMGGLKLVKVGRAGGAEADFRSDTMKVIQALGLREEVIFTEHVPVAELVAYYAGAEVCVLPSLYEGFGFPVLEAMACGCPVVNSNNSSLPEVVGDAGIKVNPRDTDDLVQAIIQVLPDGNLRQSLIQKGLAQAKKFSWEKAAKETLDVYNRVASGK